MSSLDKALDGSYVKPASTCHIVKATVNPGKVIVARNLETKDWRQNNFPIF